MSSPRSLVLQLRPSDRNRVITGPYGSINPGGKKFLLIYVHCDAEPRRAIKYHFTYKEALDFIMLGDRSTLIDEPSPMYGEYLAKDKNATWENDGPEATDTPYPFDYGSVLLMTRTDDEDEEVTVLEWDEEEEDYVLAE